MKKQTYIKRIVVLVVFFGIFLGVTSTGYAAGPPPDKSGAYKKFVSDAGAEPEITWDEETGVPTFIRGTFPANESAQNGTLSASSKDQAYAFFNRHGGLFEMDNPAAELSLLDLVETADKTHLRFQQVYQGVPVWGAQMLVHSQNGRMTAVNGHYQPGINVDVVPQITADQAETVARDVLGDAQASLEKEVELVVMTYHTEPTLTWLVSLYSDNPLGRWYYFIDAHTGMVTYYYNNLHHDRLIYDAQGTCNTSGLPGTLVANEATGGSLPAGAARDAFIFMGTAYDYFDTIFSRDSFDGSGATIESSVNFGTYGVCTGAAWNAFWNGDRFVFGSGGGGVNHFSNAEDVVVHEFTHAVTEYTGNMIYLFEQGALNESISDIFGAFAEQWRTGFANDWIMGEDLGNSNFFRSMANPPLYGQPDHMSIYSEMGQVDDNGGVHVNSGIPNKAAYLMVAGGVFHNITVTPLGRAKTEQIFYRALTDNYLSPLSGFFDARDTTIQACDDLVGSHGIVSDDCDEVQDAWAAVGIGSASATTGTLPIKVYLPILMRRSGPAYIYEPNDDVGQAYGPLSSGVFYYAYIQTDGDVDIYYFTTSGGTVNISLSSLPAGTDYDLDLYDENGYLEDWSANGGTTPESISTSLSAGTYYIYIYPWSSVSRSTDSYRLVVNYP